MLGTIIAVCFSFSAYKMAKRTGRNPVLWIVMVWVLGTALSVAFGTFGYFGDVMRATDEEIEAGPVEPRLAFWASFAGTIVGCATAVLLAGRPVQQRQVELAGVETTSA